MKRFKLLGIILMLMLIMSPFAQAFATGEHGVTLPTPTPIGQIVAGDMANNESALLSSISDYDGRVKKATYHINGDEWTVVMTCGKRYTDAALSEDMSEYEVYRAISCTPTCAPQ